MCIRCIDFCLMKAFNTILEKSSCVAFLLTRLRGNGLMKYNMYKDELILELELTLIPYFVTELFHEQQSYPIFRHISQNNWLEHITKLIHSRENQKQKIVDKLTVDDKYFFLCLQNVKNSLFLFRLRFKHDSRRQSLQDFLVGL